MKTALWISLLVAPFSIDLYGSPKTNKSAREKSSAMTNEQAKNLVAPFYDMLNTPAKKNLGELANTALADDWKSYSSETAFKTKDEFVKQVTGFGKLIPDLKWDIKEVHAVGDRIIVRSEASGTPAADFFGVPHSGKSFKIMAIDIHTVKNGKFVKAHHVEDWAGAMKQLSGK